MMEEYYTMFAYAIHGTLYSSIQSLHGLCVLHTADMYALHSFSIGPVHDAGCRVCRLCDIYIYMQNNGVMHVLLTGKLSPVTCIIIYYSV